MNDQFTSDSNIKLLWELITSFNIDKEQNKHHFESTLELVQMLNKPLIEKNKIFIQIFTNKLIEGNCTDDKNEESNDFEMRINKRKLSFSNTLDNTSPIVSNNIKKEIKNKIKDKII